MIIKGQFCTQPKKGNKFINPYVSKALPVIDSIKHFLHKQATTPVQDVPADYRFPPESMILHPDYPTVRYIGHATFIIEISGVYFLTDPIWSDTNRPFAGIKRRDPTPFSIDDLPKIDYVLISHNHFAHLDSATVKALNSKFPDITWFVPTGLRKWFHKRGIKKVVELSWWQHFECETEGNEELSVQVTAVPAQHCSGRSLFDQNKSLWCGFVVDVVKEDNCQEKHRNFYFSGDTGYNEHDFLEIGKKWGEIDLALIPIGSDGKKAHNSMHVTPKEAVQIHQDVNAKMSVSMHWKTFQNGNRPFNQAPYELHSALKEAEIPTPYFRVLQPGYAINW